MLSLGHLIDLCTRIFESVVAALVSGNSGTAAPKYISECVTSTFPNSQYYANHSSHCSGNWLRELFFAYGCWKFSYDVSTARGLRGAFAVAEPSMFRPSTLRKGCASIMRRPPMSSGSPSILTGLGIDAQCKLCANPTGVA